MRCTRSWTLSVIDISYDRPVLSIADNTWRRLTCSGEFFRSPECGNTVPDESRRTRTPILAISEMNFLNTQCTIGVGTPLCQNAPRLVGRINTILACDRETDRHRRMPVT